MPGVSFASVETVGLAVAAGPYGGLPTVPVLQLRHSHQTRPSKIRSGRILVRKVPPLR